MKIVQGSFLLQMEVSNYLVVI